MWALWGLVNLTINWNQRSGLASLKFFGFPFLDASSYYSYYAYPWQCPKQEERWTFLYISPYPGGKSQNAPFLKLASFCVLLVRSEVCTHAGKVGHHSSPSLRVKTYFLSMLPTQLKKVVIVLQRKALERQVTGSTKLYLCLKVMSFKLNVFITSLHYLW